MSRKADTPKTRVLTKEQVIANFSANGQTFTAFAADNRFELSLVYAVLHGRVKGLRGQSHNIAVALGLKDGRRTDKPVRKASSPTRNMAQQGVAA